MIDVLVDGRDRLTPDQASTASGDSGPVFELQPKLRQTGYRRRPAGRRRRPIIHLGGAKHRGDATSALSSSSRFSIVGPLRGLCLQPDRAARGAAERA
jgi:hypothetical protein